MERINIVRKLNLQKTLERKSVFLFGPRQTGKSWIVRQTLGQELSYNLLDSNVMLKLSRSPNLIREEMTEQTQIIVIDEVQRLPQILETVHFMIEEYGVRFLLTSSSARKLRR
ncbi:MAG: AAA family ATPase [Planctomycetaceae bacterium]|jgi:predicted AAA+ superfamily ATPase|nr:AAA family ATPase [Planctomycetaceae bacterium]